MAKNKPTPPVIKKSLRERLEDNIIIVVIAACVATGSVVAGVVAYIYHAKIEIMEAEFQSNIARYKHIVNEGTYLINYNSHSITDVQDAPNESDRFFEGIVLAQPPTETTYFNPWKVESVFAVSDTMIGTEESPASTKEAEAYVEKNIPTVAPIQFVWRGKTSHKISSAVDSGPQTQCGYKNVFHYFSVSKTALKDGESYDGALISIIQDSFTRVVDPESAEVDQISLGRQGRTFILEMKTVCQNVRIDNNPTPTNLYILQRQVIFRVKDGYVTVREFVPSEDRIVSDKNVLAAEMNWWGYFRVFSN